MSIYNRAGFSRRTFLKTTGPVAVPASFFTACAQAPTTLNVLAWYTVWEASK